MTGILERTLGILECLAAHPQGLPLAAIAESLSIPRSAAHRLLADLCRAGYARQIRDHGDYVMTTRLPALGLHFLSNCGAVDLAQPLLDRLGEVSGELVRLGVVDGERLAFVAKAQGARRGLRYDPDMGTDAQLSCTASGHAWLSTMPDEKAVEMVSRQGFGQPAQFGPNAPTSVHEFLDCLRQVRKRGYAVTRETFSPGLAAMAAPVMRAGRPAVGVISIAGPLMRLTDARMSELGPLLLAAAAELAAASGASLLFDNSARSGGVHKLASS